MCSIPLPHDPMAKLTAWDIDCNNRMMRSLLARRGVAHSPSNKGEEAAHVQRKLDTVYAARKALTQVRRFSNFITLQPPEDIPLFWGTQQQKLQDALDRLGEVGRLFGKLEPEDMSGEPENMYHLYETERVQGHVDEVTGKPKFDGDTPRKGKDKVKGKDSSKSR